MHDDPTPHEHLSVILDETPWAQGVDDVAFAGLIEDVIAEAERRLRRTTAG